MLIKTLQEIDGNYICDSCDYSSCNKYYFNKHLLTPKHKKLTKTPIPTPNCRIPTTNEITCEKCNYTTSKNSDYKKHLLTAKHKQLMQNNMTTNCLECNICNKKYNSRAGLWLHKKKCTIVVISPNLDVIQSEENVFGAKIVDEVEDFPRLVTRIGKAEHFEKGTNVTRDTILKDTTFIMKIIKENQEFKNLFLEQCKQVETQQKQAEIQQKQLIELQKENNIIMNKMVEITQQQLTVPSNVTNNNNIVNNQFNLSIFLNENCKNAVNFSDFINNIQVTDDDLENNAKMGFVEGVTKIIMDNLRLLELTNRPIHCTDVKRETIYVKQENQWDKENSNKVIQRGIQDITCKNMQQLVEWREENPSYAEDMDSELGEKSIVMQQNSMAGCKREEYYPKIIKNIAKETILDKKRFLE